MPDPAIEKAKGLLVMPSNQALRHAEPRVNADSKKWAVVSHLSAFLTLLGIPSLIGTVVTWALKKQDDPFVDFHGKEAVNFNLSFLIYGAVSAVLVVALVGLLLLPIVAMTWLVLVIVGAVKASAGEYYRYPSPSVSSTETENPDPSAVSERFHPFSD
jgi:uncharacterized Tic20 family protein